MSVPARTTAAAVQGILGGNYDVAVAPDLTPFIASASAVVDRVATMALAKRMGGGPIILSATELESIEKWLAAHLYAQQDPLYTSRSTQGASGSFQVGQLGEGFASTQYGRTAMDLDYSGCLKNLNKQQRAGGFWLGKPPSAQTPYSQRD